MVFGPLARRAILERQMQRILRPPVLERGVIEVNIRKPRCYGINEIYLIKPCDVVPPLLLRTSPKAILPRLNLKMT